MTSTFGEDVEDQYHLTFILMYCLGTLAQVSGSIFPNAQMYWKYKLRDTNKPWNPSSNTTTELQDEFTADFALVGNITTIVAMIISVIYTRTWNLTHRMIGCLTAYICMFVTVIIFVGIDTDSWQKEFLYMTLLIIFMISCINACFLVTLFQMCAKFSPVYISALLSGQALCGIFSSSLQIVTLSIDAKPEINGFLYFSATVAFIVLVAVSFVSCLKYSPFFIYHLKQTSNITATKVDIPKGLIASIFERQKFVFASMLLIIGISSMVHPGITATIVSTEPGSKWSDTFFVPVITFFVYNCVDLFGRETALRIGKPTNEVVVLILSLLRITLIPVLLFCNLSAKHHSTVLFKNDIVYILVIILIAISNGYLTNICVIMLPKNYEGSGKDRTLTIAILFFLLLLGSGIFSFLGLALLKLM